MPQSESEGWQELQTLSRRSCPKLFYQFSTQDQSLTLLLTDLICIWESSLDEYDIKAAASRQGTTIDPSDSPQQFQVLLSKIRKSLSDGENRITRGTERNSQTLLLRTKIALPKPLKALEWTFTLNPQPTSELAERILRPSLHEVAVSSNKITSLLGIIKEKDHVISKLLDRIGTSGVDLNLVFPSIAGFASRKGGHVSVADAKKHVAGIAEFDETSWTKGFASDDGYEGADRTGLGNLVRGCEKCFAHSKAEHDSWVKDLPTTDRVDQGSNGDQGKSRAKDTSEAKPDTEDESTDDEFERQPTPPHLKPKSPSVSRTTKPTTKDDEAIEQEVSPPSKRAKPTKIGGLGKRNATKAFGASQSPTKASVPAKEAKSPRRRASTTSAATETASEDEDIQSPSHRKHKSPTPEPAAKSKLGKFSKKEAPVRSSSVTPSPPPSPMPTRSRPARGSPPVAENNAADEETETEDDDLNVSPPPPPKPKTESKASTPAKAPRLGRLGAKKQSTPAKSASPDPVPEDDEQAEKPSPSKKKIGRLGGLRKKAQSREPTSSPPPPASAQKAPRGKDDDESDGTDSPSPSPSRTSNARQAKSDDQASSSPAPPPKKTDPLPKKEETAEEAATRRRMELKRTIEAAGAGRKKRRF
ncbi:hypothetical protein H2200_000168 [Cladophialophora chaetospira]|uniref:Non-homologous end-joining factor 1 n=1 Tax=Cladophialophora chaetospira TaxID=386627 RepID=A0AA39CQ29_9EURO|nr:hypothetical protein H2200_000168 [Cladophialophora chaetospira]